MKKGVKKKQKSEILAISPKRNRNRGQIWVETVIYTLIALAMIGAVLAFALPQIEKIQDEATIEQSISVVQNINNVILSVVQGGPGNKRLVETKIKKGNLNIDASGDKIVFEIESSKPYSEPCSSENCDSKIVNIGNIDVLTRSVGGINKVTLTTSYNYDIRYENTQNSKIISESPTSYTISIENLGKNDNGETIVDIKLV